MRISLRATLLLITAALLGAAGNPPAGTEAAPAQRENRVSPLTAEQLVQILDQTVD